jgi:hypothetical protein
VGRFVTTHKLDDDIGFRIGNQVSGRIGQEVGRKAPFAGCVDISNGDPDEFQALAAVRGESIGPFSERSGDLGSDRSGAEQRHPKRGSGHRGVTERRFHMAPRW